MAPDYGGRDVRKDWPGRGVPFVTPPPRVTNPLTGESREIGATVHAVEQTIDTPGTLYPNAGVNHGAILATISNKTGQADVHLEGGRYVASWRAAISTTAMPADGTVDGAALQVGRVVDLANVATLALDAKLYVKAACYSQADGSGVRIGYLTGIFRRDTKDSLITGYLGVGDIIPFNDQQQYETFYPAFTAPDNFVADNLLWSPRGAGTAGCLLPFKVPVGSTLTEVAVATFRRGAGDTFGTLRLDKNSLGTLTTLATFAPGVGNILTVVSVSQVVGLGDMFTLIVSATNAAAWGAWLSYLRIKYTSPDYEVRR
jgi:hypothetical protein